MHFKVWENKLPEYGRGIVELVPHEIQLEMDYHLAFFLCVSTIIHISQNAFRNCFDYWLGMEEGSIPQPFFMLRIANSYQYTWRSQGEAISTRVFKNPIKR